MTQIDTICFQHIWHYTDAGKKKTTDIEICVYYAKQLGNGHHKYKYHQNQIGSTCSYPDHYQHVTCSSISLSCVHVQGVKYSVLSICHRRH